MFNPLRRRKSSNVSTPTESSTHFKWFGQSAFKSFSKLIDSSLSNVSEQLLDHIQNASYDIDLNNARRETFNNERYMNQHRFNQPAIPQPQEIDHDSNRDEEIKKIKKALSEYREYKKSKDNTSNTPSKYQNYQYGQDLNDSMN